MDKCREAFERFECEKYEANYDDMKKNWDWYESQFGYRYSPDSLRGKDWAIWQEAWQHQQAKVEELEKEWLEMNQQHERAVKECFEVNSENRKLQKRVDALELKLREIAGIARRARHGEYYTESGRNAGLNIAAEIEQALKGGGQ
ncbi:hypothetical protein ACLD0L_00145 [Acinetobacter baumannii]